MVCTRGKSITQVYFQQMSQPEQKLKIKPTRWQWLSTCADIAVQGLNDQRTELVTNGRNNFHNYSDALFSFDEDGADGLPSRVCTAEPKQEEAPAKGRGSENSRGCVLVSNP